MYNKDIAGNDLQTIISQAIDDMKRESPGPFDLANLNLAELERRTGISRGKLRRLQKNAFSVKPHGNTGRQAPSRIIDGFTGVINRLLADGVTNSVVLLERLQAVGVYRKSFNRKELCKRSQASYSAKKTGRCPTGKSRPPVFNRSRGILSDGLGIYYR